MLITGCVNQPHLRTNRDLIQEILAHGGIDHVDVAAAYVTTGGARDLLQTMATSFGAQWEHVNKRWLIAFDYCRTDPVAAGMLKELPHSSVRVHDGAKVVEHKCMPTVPFHPKAFLFRGAGRHALFAGSGNVSRSGLNTGHEVGLMLDCRPPANGDAAIREQIAGVQQWYEIRWNAASALTHKLADRYRTLFDSADNLKHPTPTEDDLAKPDERRSTLSAEDLHKLRAANHFWIEADKNITPNLGKNKPGNQLMMTRLSRVFFGVPPKDVPQNSPLTKLTISYGAHAKDDCSLTFSDNGMDKLTLPIPGAGGPPAYDGENLLFTRVKAGTFELELGTKKRKQQWVRKSEAIDARHKMAGGRQWGVF